MPGSKRKTPKKNQPRGDWGDRHCFVYFLLSPTLGRVKIGTTSDNPHFRFLALNTLNPEPLIKLGIIPRARGLERALHKKFHQYRQHGEWFDLSEEIIGYIKEHAFPWPEHRYSFNWLDSLSEEEARMVEENEKEMMDDPLPPPDAVYAYVRTDQDDSIPCPECGGRGIGIDGQCEGCGGTGLDTDRDRKEKFGWENKGGYEE